MESTGLKVEQGQRVFILPAVFLLLFLTIFPLFFTLYLTLNSWQISKIGAGIEFVGFRNFVRIAGDSRFWKTLLNTVIFVFGGVILQFLIGLGLALLLNRIRWGNKFFRVIFLLPMMIAPIAVGYMFRMIYHQTLGPLNVILVYFGLKQVAWIDNLRLALLSVIIADTWQWTSFMTIILLAGLKALPVDMYEAAQIDGATAWKRFLKITFPMIFPIATVAFLLRMIEAFKVIDIIYTATGGGPGIATESTTMYIYISGLRYFNLGYASAMSYSMLFIIIIISMLFLKLIQRKVQEVR
jgi:multiple sugar transport system permease protein